MSIESMMPSHNLSLHRPLLLLPSIFPSIEVFSNESTLRMRWPKYWSFSFSISLSNEHSGLISFRIDWLDLLAVQRDFQESSPTLQFRSTNSSVLSSLYSPTLTLYTTTGKTIALTRQTFDGKIMSLLFKTLSRLVIVFSSNEQESFNFMAAVIIFSDFGAQENKICHCFHCFPIYML